MITLRNNLERAVPLVNLFVGVANTALSFLPRLTPTNARNPNNFGFSPMRRDTYVCFPVTRADDRGTHAEKKGPLFHVNCAKVAEERARLGEDAMGWCRKGKFQQCPLSSTLNGLLNRYLLSQERKSRRELSWDGFP